jgi:CHAT domain-containing protein/Tfp pilus assembly protein PilF
MWKQTNSLVLIIVMLALCQLSAAAQEDSFQELERLDFQIHALLAQRNYGGAIPLLKKFCQVTEDTYGHDHEKTALALNNLGDCYRLTGNFAEAELLLQKSVQIWEKVRGKNDPEVALTLNSLGNLYVAMNRYSEAVALYKKVLNIMATSPGFDEIEIAQVLGNLAWSYRCLGQYDQAEALYKKSLTIYERQPGWVDKSVSLNGLASVFVTCGRYAEAEPLYQESLEIAQKKLGEEAPEVAQILNNLGILYMKTARYAMAEPRFKRALEIREKKLGPETPDVAQTLVSLEDLYRILGRDREAKISGERALKIYEKRHLLDGLDAATCLNNLGALALKSGHFPEAEAKLKKALEIKEKRLGPDHPEIAIILGNLAALYFNTGRYGEAESSQKRVLAIQEKKLGPDHPAVAHTLNNLGEFYRNTSRYAEAELNFTRALEIREQKLGKEHPDVATSLIGLAKTFKRLAEIYHNPRLLDEAEKRFKQALEIKKKKLSPEHPEVAFYLQDLGMLYRLRGRYAEAESCLKKSLEIQQKKLGPDAPALDASWNDLGVIYSDTGRNDEAERLYKRALEIREKYYGKNSPHIVNFLFNLASLYTQTGKFNLAQQYFLTTITIREQEQENVFQQMTEGQKLFYSIEKSSPVHLLLTLTAKHLQKNKQAVNEAFNVWLRWKGTVTESESRITEACARSHDPRVLKKGQELLNVRRTLARLYTSMPSQMDPDTYRRTIREYEGRRNDLESELSRLSQDFSLEKLVGKADMQSISALLPRGSVYLDFALIAPYDFKTNGFEKRLHLLVFILTPGDKPQVALEDLGYSTAIDRHIQAYHRIIQEGVSYERPPDEAALKEQLRALFHLVMEPLLPHLHGSKQLFISPDGDLNLIPFETFITPEGKYLMDDTSIHYIAAGRDILRFKDTAVAQGQALILADPDYDLGEQGRVEAAEPLKGPEPASRGLPLEEAQTLRPFERLEGTKIEAEEIEKILKEQGAVKCYEDKAATQEVLFAAAPPRVLHIATHGYFFPDPEAALGTVHNRETLPPEAVEAYKNPMRRSGIALAGANTSLRQGKDYGLVSAEKIQGLALKGTDLVVLSACETGVGKVQAGEGVFGLKRAFILSGARTVVMSLWNVPSEETTEFMESFYTLLAKGKPKAAALREAKWAMMKKNSNPFFWGAFVMVGDPGQ